MCILGLITMSMMSHCDVTNHRRFSVRQDVDKFTWFTLNLQIIRIKMTSLQTRRWSCLYREKAVTSPDPLRGYSDWLLRDAQAAFCILFLVLFRSWAAALRRLCSSGLFGGTWRDAHGRRSLQSPILFIHRFIYCLYPHTRCKPDEMMGNPSDDQKCPMIRHPLKQS